MITIKMYGSGYRVSGANLYGLFTINPLSERSNQLMFIARHIPTEKKLNATSDDP